MNPNPVDELPLLELFTRLREAGLPLGINEYQLVLRSLQAGFGIQDREALAKLCRTLWIKSAEEERLFNYHFEQIIGDNSSSHFSVRDSPSQKKRIDKKSLTLSYLFLHSPEHWLWISGVGICLISVLLSLLIPFFENTYLTPAQSPAPELLSPTTSPPTSKKTKVLSSPIPAKSIDPTSSPIDRLFRLSNPVFSTWDSNPSFRWSVLGVIFGLGIAFWAVLATIRRNYRSKPRQLAIKTNTIATTKLSTELIQQIGDEVRVARLVRRRLGGDGEMGNRSLTNPEFFPITRRQMKQSWRYLRRFIREGAPTEIDIDATIRCLGKQGLLLEPVLVPSRVNQTELLLLIDQDGSMVPFHSLSQRLIETAVQGGRLGNASVYYFHNCPTDYVYHDAVHQEAVAIEDFLAKLNPRTAVLIFSDAGSARGGFNPRRRRATKTFVDDLKQHVRYSAWLNPMPQSRWASTTAGDIAKMIPMFEMSRQGLDGAIDVLRGRYK